MDMDKLMFTYDNSKHPESYCSAPCSKKEAQMYVDETKCCWTCVPLYWVPVPSYTVSTQSIKLHLKWHFVNLDKIRLEVEKLKTHNINFNCRHICEDCPYGARPSLDLSVCIPIPQVNEKCINGDTFDLSLSSQLLLPVLIIISNRINLGDRYT